MARHSQASGGSASVGMVTGAHEGYSALYHPEDLGWGREENLWLGG